MSSPSARKPSPVCSKNISLLVDTRLASLYNLINFTISFMRAIYVFCYFDFITCIIITSLIKKKIRKLNFCSLLFIHWMFNILFQLGLLLCTDESRAIIHHSFVTNSEIDLSRYFFYLKYPAKTSFGAHHKKRESFLGKKTFPIFAIYENKRSFKNFLIWKPLKYTYRILTKLSLTKCPLKYLKLKLCLGLNHCQ